MKNIIPAKYKKDIKCIYMFKDGFDIWCEEKSKKTGATNDYWLRVNKKISWPLDTEENLPDTVMFNFGYLGNCPLKVQEVLSIYSLEMYHDNLSSGSKDHGYRMETVTCYLEDNRSIMESKYHFITHKIAYTHNFDFWRRNYTRTTTAIWSIDLDKKAEDDIPF